jgi:hypothetical protein
MMFQSGRHRNIPQHVTLAFVALAQLTSLSTAQNLFYVLLLFTPVPLTKESSTAASYHILTPHSIILSLPALLSFLFLAFLPTLRESSIYASVTSIGYFIIPLLLTSLVQPNATHKVEKHTSVHQARRAYEDIFRVLAFASFGLHMMRSYHAIIDEAPPHRYLSHNFVWNTHRDEGNTRYQQAWTVLVRVIGALSDNPVISQVGWDVLISVLSLCVWAVAHGVDVTAMLRCSGLLWSIPTPSIKNGSLVPKSLLNGSSTKSEVGSVVEEIADGISVASPNKRGRGRPKKTGAAIAKDHLSSSTPPASASATGSLRRSTRNRHTSSMSQASYDSASDGEYVPTQATQDEVDEFDFDNDEGLAKETEAAALAWGLYIVGGLGAVTAGVLGAESTGR